VDESFVQRPELRVEMMWLIGSSLASLQAFADAEPILRDVAATSARLFGDSDARTIRAEMSMANVHRFRGRLDAMDTVVTRSLHRLRALPARDGALMVTALLDSVHLAIDRGQASRALEPAREAMRIARQQLPEGHEMRVNAAQMWAVALEHDARDHEAALEAASAAMEATRAYYGGSNSHPRVVDAHLILGRALGRVGRNREAIAVLQRADSASAIGMGADNMTRAFIRASMASYRLMLGQEAGALADYDESRRLFAANGDTTSISYAIVQGHRGNLLVRLERPAEAIVPLTDALRMMGEVRGADHPRLLPYRIRLAVAEASLGRADGAARTLDALASRMADTLGVPVATRSAWLHARGVIAHLRRDPITAVSLMDSALRIGVDSSAASSQLPLRVDLGLALLDAGDTARARATLDSAKAAFRATGQEVTRSERRAEQAIAMLRQRASGSM
jgi:tetratricopeptide (TPR) repeat protein